MSDQEMQFADPAWRPPQQRSTNLTTPPTQPQQPYMSQPINMVAHEQSLPAPEESLTNAYTEGYQVRQAQQPRGIPLRRQPRQRGRFGPAFWILLPLLLLALIGGISYANPFEYQVPGNAVYVASSKPQPIDRQHYPVGIHPTIIVNNPIGSIYVHTGGSVNDVAVQTTNEESVQAEVNPDSDTVTIAVDNTGPVDIDVTVADEADLVLKTTIGNIEVTGVSGQLSLTSDGGSINLSQVTLTRNSSVKTHTGTITFDGAIDPDGSYQFESDTGVINVRLPDNASYHLDVTTNGGSFNSDPPIPTPDANQASNGFQIDVGKPPRAILILKTDIGSINLSNQRQ